MLGSRTSTRQPSEPKCICRLAAPRPPAMGIEKAASEPLISILSGSRSMLITPISCKRRKSTGLNSRTQTHAERRNSPRCSLPLGPGIGRYVGNLVRPLLSSYFVPMRPFQASLLPLSQGHPVKRNRVSAVLRTGSLIAWTGTLCLVLVNVHGAYAQTPAKSHRKAIVKVQPQYPAVLKNGHFEGQVRIYATVLADGSVAKVEVK